MESSGDDRKAMEELVRGREFAKQLRQVINIDDDDDELAFAQHLVNNVLNSFTNTLFLLDEPHEVQLRDPSFIKSDEDSHESCKSKLRRGCYKRRKTTQTWEKVSETPTDDGHQWRKYGQKMILNAKYSRNYYRCTHKFDQRCQATKQVQRIQEKTPLYKTTYYGHHTCKTSLNPDIILDPTSPHDTSILLSFNNTFPTPTKQDCPFLSSSFSSPSVNEEVPSTSLDLDDYLLSPEPTLDNSARHVTDGTLSSTLESHHKDVMYGVFYDSVELDDVFQPFVGF